MTLPTEVEDINDLDVCQPAKWLIGFWLCHARPRPASKPSSWFKSGIRPNSYWGAGVKARLAEQVNYIRHWQVEQVDYEELSNVEATWFIDPPYQIAGKSYTHGSKDIDYVDLGEWCKSRKGQVIVCENKGADWLPFKDEFIIKSQRGFSKEVVYIQ